LVNCTNTLGKIHLNFLLNFKSRDRKLHSDEPINLITKTRGRHSNINFKKITEKIFVSLPRKFSFSIFLLISPTFPQSHLFLALSHFHRLPSQEKEEKLDKINHLLVIHVAHISHVAQINFKIFHGIKRFSIFCTLSQILSERKEKKNY
jgi:hypothetical protein